VAVVIGTAISNGVIFYGTGLDNDLQRHTDWWKLDGLLSVPDDPVNDLQLFPSPGTSGFTITGLPEGAFEIRISDMQGREVFVASHTMDRRFDGSRWENGIYVIAITDASGRAYRACWVKQ